ncbi:MAG: RDD family protein [Sedimentitalea sp.]
MSLPDPDRQPQFYTSVPIKRFVAWLVDTALILLLCLVMIPLTGFIALLIWPVMYLALGFAYRTVTLANGSATLGMRFAGVEMRCSDGSRFDLNMAMAHTAGYTISFAMPVLQVVSVAMMLTTARAQGLSDSALGTVALNRHRRF